VRVGDRTLVDGDETVTLVRRAPRRVM